jgi:hypothetical protein
MNVARQALAVFLAISFGVAPAAAQTVNAITLHAVRHPGAAATDVSGTAPPFTSVVVTLHALISFELPIVYVREARTQTDSRGQFALTLSDSPVAFRPVTFQINATSSTPGVVPATVRIESSDPTPAFRSSVDEIPPEYR